MSNKRIVIRSKDTQLWFFPDDLKLGLRLASLDPADHETVEVSHEDFAELVRLYTDFFKDLKKDWQPYTPLFPRWIKGRFRRKGLLRYQYLVGGHDDQTLRTEWKLAEDHRQWE